MQQIHISTSNLMRNNHNKDRIKSCRRTSMMFPSSLGKQERSTSTESTISTGHVKDIILSPIAACKSLSSTTEMITTSHSTLCSPPPSPKNKKSDRHSHVEPTCQHPSMHSGRKKAVYRNRTSPPFYNKKSIPKTRSDSSSDVCNKRHSPSAAAAAVLNAENLLDKAVLDSCNSSNDAESSYSYSSHDHLLDKNNDTISKKTHSYPSYDCNYKYTQEAAYEEFGVERRLIEASHKGQSSPSLQQLIKIDEDKKKKHKKHWIKVRKQSQVTLPRKPSFTGLKKATSLGSKTSPSEKSSAPKKETAVRKGSAPPSYFQVDIKDGEFSSSSVGYYSAPIETELHPDQSLSQMGMEVSEEDYCIEGEYMARQLQQHHHSAYNENQRKSSRKLSESVLSMKGLAKGLGSLEKPCNPKVIKTKVLSALRRGSNDNTTKDAGSKKIPHQIAITVTPSTSEDTYDDHLSLNDMKLFYKWHHARCRQDVNHFPPSRGVIPSNTGVETAITKRASDDVMSITSSVGDRTVSVDNRRCRTERQMSF